MIYVDCQQCGGKFEYTEAHANASKLYCGLCQCQVVLDAETRHLLNKRRLVDYNLADLKKEQDLVTVSFPWTKSYFLLLFAVIPSLVGCMGLLAEIAGTTDYLPPERQAGFFMGVMMPILSMIVGLICTYVVVAMWSNRTIVSITSEQISTQCKPIPWPNYNQEFFCSDIQQFYVQRYASHTKKTGRKEETVYRYKVMAQTVNGGRMEILNAIDSYTRAITLEHLFEQTLGIVDQIVPEETRH